MDIVQVAKTSGLRRVGARPPFFSYLKQTWQRRDFIYSLANYRLRASLEKNRLGVVWLLLRPCLDAAVYGTIFGFLMSSAARGPDYITHIVVGVFLWQFFAGSFLDGAKSIINNRPMVQSLAFPRLTLPLSAVVEHALSMVPSLILLAIILPFTGHWPSPSWLLMIPLLVLYSFFNAGVAMIAARLTVHLTDLSEFLPYLVRILFYTSGVLFNVSTLFPKHPHIVDVYNFYPMYQVLQIARVSLMNESSYNSFYWISFTAWTVVLFVVGLLFFWVAEERYGRD